MSKDFHISPQNFLSGQIGHVILKIILCWCVFSVSARVQMQMCEQCFVTRFQLPDNLTFYL